MMDKQSVVSSVGLPIAATILTAASPLLKRISQVDGAYEYNVNMIYFAAEVLKLIIATMVFHSGREGNFCTALASGEQQRRFALTAFLFFVQNNLGFVVLLYFSASSFQLLMNLRIVAVALISVPLLNKVPTPLQWCAIGLLCTGGMQHFLSMNGDAPLSDTSILGLTAMLATVATSALANVYNQLALQADVEMPLMLQNMFLYSYGVVFNALNWGRSIYIGGNPPFGQITLSVVLLVLFTAVYGLCISAVLKHLGAMVRSVLGILAIVVTAVGEYAFFRTVPTLFADTTFLVIIVSAQVYSKAPMLPKEPPPEAEKEELVDQKPCAAGSARDATGVTLQAQR